MRKLATVCCGFCAAVYLSVYVIPQGWRWIAALILAALGALSLLLPRRRRICMMLALSAAVGCMWTWSHTAFVLAPADRLAGQTLTVTARVVSLPEEHDYGTRVYVRLETGPKARAMLYDYDHRVSSLRPGDRITAEVRFSSAQMLYGEQTDRYTAKGVFVRGYFHSAPQVLSHGGRLRYIPLYLSHDVQELTRSCFPEDSAAFFCALLTGDKNDLYTQQALYDDLCTAGLQHIVAVSGMHVAFLTMLVRCFAGRKHSVVLGIPILAVFVLMAGCTPSVMRAAFMQIVLLLSVPLRRETDPLTSLSFVLAALLAINPASAASVSLQLSFSSVAGLLLFSRPLYDAMLGRAGGHAEGSGLTARALRGLFGSVAATLSAIVFSTPLAAIHFGSVPLLSPVTNLLCLTPVAFCFAAGWAVCLLGAIWLPLGQLAGWLVAWPLRWVMLVVHVISRAPYAAVYTCGALVGWWLAAIYAVIVFCAIRRRSGRRVRPMIAAGVCAAMLACILAGNMIYWSAVPRMTMLDVSQGQSIALFSGRDTVVIDCGSNGTTDDAGTHMTQYLRGCGRQKVNLLLLTHLHADHAGGAARLIRQMRVQMLVLPADAENNADLLDEILEAADEAGTRVYQIRDRAELSVGPLSLQLWCAGKNGEREMAVVSSLGAFDLLVTGDLELSVERELVREVTLPKCEVMVAGHHGSRYASSDELIEAADPDVALISVGYNTYGHPTPETLARYAAHGIPVLRTDEQGNIVLRMDETDHGKAENG